MCPCYAKMEKVFGKKDNVTSVNQFHTTSDAENENNSGSEAPYQGEIREESNSGLSAYEQRQKEVQKAQAENKTNRGVNGEVNHGNKDNESPSGTPSNGNRQKFFKQSCFSLKEHGKRLDQENLKLRRKIIEDYVSIEQMKLEEQIKKSKCDYSLEKEKMKCQFQLEQEKLNWETKLKEKEV
ncbi:hypothetical protein O181_001115 [Austropuccinia psidii MF-1]|uniref:Uncharacterized protein n=1 Tax=Austropuccinia psidii MF-1 TaxID=1389203 RepID=A0A9Q3BAD0_9BASI|nr:hypothetical protein [Austropuccinia psidii MF-1]